MLRRILAFVAAYLMLLCASALYFSEAQAGGNYFIQPDEVSIVTKHFYPYSRHPAFYRSQMNDALELNLNTNILHYFYWDNYVHAETDYSQFRHIGYNFRFGVRVFDWLELYWHHHSQHAMDDTYPAPMRFPAEDAYAFKIKVWEQRPRGKALLELF